MVLLIVLSLDAEAVTIATRLRSVCRVPVSVIITNLCPVHTADTDKTRHLSCPCRRCEQKWRQVKTVGDRKFRICFVQSRNAVRTWLIYINTLRRSAIINYAYMCNQFELSHNATVQQFVPNSKLFNRIVISSILLLQCCVYIVIKRKPLNRSAMSVYGVTSGYFFVCMFSWTQQQLQHQLRHLNRQRQQVPKFCFRCLYLSNKTSIRNLSVAA